jgi:prepilin-type processing-associated H-X9-DG protein
MSVIIVLVVLLFPSLALVRETANRVVCGSNIRQIGFGLAMYADEQRGALPHTVFLGRGNGRAAPQEMVNLYVPKGSWTYEGAWDGLGLLFDKSFLPSPGVFYCPSHRFTMTYEMQQAEWKNPDDTEIVGNYQFRGEGKHHERYLHEIDPGSTAIVADAIRTRDEFNHGNGANVLRADLSVLWFRDTVGQFAEILPDKTSHADPESTSRAWRSLDQLFDGGAR